MLIKSPPKKLFLATGNQGKINEFKTLFEDLPVNLQLKPKSFEIEESGNTFAQNARIKAIEVARKIGHWAIADDSGLCVNALNGAPGVLSARYGSNDSERISRLLNELDRIDDRSAYFSCAICLASEDGTVLLEVEGVSEGRIVKVPRGSHGFGYDPVFEVVEIGLTFAEISKEKKSKFGHRGQAFKLFKPAFNKLLLDQNAPKI